MIELTFPRNWYYQNNFIEWVWYLYFDYKNANCCCIISAISKSEATKLLQNIDLTEKSGIL